MIVLWARFTPLAQIGSEDVAAPNLLNRIDSPSLNSLFSWLKGSRLLVSANQYFIDLLEFRRLALSPVFQVLRV